MFGVAVQSMDFVVSAYNSGRVWLPGSREYTSDECEHLANGQENGEAVNLEERKTWGLFQKSSIRRRFSMGKHKSERTSGNMASPRSIELAVLKAGQGVESRNTSAPKKRRNIGIDSERRLNHQPSV